MTSQPDAIHIRGDFTIDVPEGQFHFTAEDHRITLRSDNWQGLVSAAQRFRRMFRGAPEVPIIQVEPAPPRVAPFSAGRRASDLNAKRAQLRQVAEQFADLGITIEVVEDHKPFLRIGKDAGSRFLRLAGLPHLQILSMSPFLSFLKEQFGLQTSRFTNW